jgi:mutual gliding-motility protein MglA
MHYNKERNELILKIVYLGPDGAGKTTNLRQLRQLAPKDSIGRIERMISEQDDSVRIEMLSVHLGEVGGKRISLQLWTAPGRLHAREARIPILEEVDGIVFVADSQRTRLDHNRTLMAELRDIVINHFGRSPRSVPVVIQLNKRDDPDILGIAEISRALEAKGTTIVEARAHEGRGVMTSLRTLTEELIVKLRFMHLIADQGDGCEAKGLAAIASHPRPQETQHHSSSPFADADEDGTRISTASDRIGRLSGTHRPSTVMVKSRLVQQSADPFDSGTQTAVETPDPDAESDEVDPASETNLIVEHQKKDLRIVDENGRRVLRQTRPSEALEALMPKAIYECGTMGQEIRDLFHQMPSMVKIAGLLLIGLISVLWFTIWII